ncbi:MAG: ABC transporter ATP-binding protein [Clostridia bacterium]|nr:ABC transporter ATP-binding protein [Clostridia bacterium]
METQNQTKPMRMGYLIRRFLPYYKKYVWVLILDLICASLSTVCDLVFPMIIRYITDMGINNIGALTVGVILKLAMLYLVLRIIDAAANFYMANQGHVMGAKMETDMRRDLFDHLQTLSYSYYSNHKVGQLMARMTGDLNDITEFAHHCPEEFFICGLKIIVSFAILSTINIPLTVIMFATFPIVIVFTKYFNVKMRRAFKEQRRQVGEVNAQVEDSLLGIRVVKSFSGEEAEAKKFRVGNEKFLATKKNSFFYMAGFSTSTRAFGGIMYLAVVVFGSLFMIRGRISPADLTAYLLYVNTLLVSVRTIIQFTEQFQRGMTGIERFIEVMDTEPDITEAKNAKELVSVHGDVEFRNVSFHYNDEEDRDVLCNINLKIDAGKSVAIVGPSGGGKTTMCNLLPRFYDVTDGEILIDGNNISDVTLKSLRNAIGMVEQDVYLFSGTVLENILYGKSDATQDEVIAAAKMAGAHEFIMMMPNGYDTYVGERGVKLSGGQKQRLSIARVFLKNPPILVLDEATSALDNESEKLVQKSLEELAKGRTVFTIAHRLTTIKNADIILVLTENGIVEQGTHKELLDMNGIYAGFYKLYS